MFRNFLFKAAGYATGTATLGGMAYADYRMDQADLRKLQETRPNAAFQYRLMYRPQGLFIQRTIIENEPEQRNELGRR